MKTSVATAAVILGILIAGLWPFRFHPPNDVRRDPQAGLVFGTRGIAYATKLDWCHATSCDFSIALWLNSRGPVTTHVADILCITERPDCSEFLLGQWQSSLLLRASFQDPRGPVRRQLVVGDVLTANRWRYVVVTSGERETRLFVDGKLRATHLRPLSIEHGRGDLVVGNGPFGEQSWAGAMQDIAIYNAELRPDQVLQQWTASRGRPPISALVPTPSLLLTSGVSSSNEGVPTRAIYVPQSFVPLRRAFLEWDFRLDRKGVTDIVVNLCGFVPFGVVILTALRNKPRGHLFTIVSAALLSSAIEITQTFIPGRSSSSTDILFNTLGAGLGVVTYLVFCRVRHTR